MYFAMIPKRSFLEDAVLVLGIGAGAIYGAKWLLGEQKFNEYKRQLKDAFTSGKKTPEDLPAVYDSAAAEEPDMGAQEEENILARIRRAYRDPEAK